jgi:hypothetical protein
MHTKPPQPGQNGSKSCQLVGSSLNTSLIGAQPERRHRLVHRNAANAATRNMTRDAKARIVSKTGSSTNKKDNAVGCEYIHSMLNSRELTVYHSAGVRREPRDQFTAACYRKCPWSINEFICTVRDIIHHDDVSCGIIEQELRDNHPQGWSKQDIITFDEATEEYIIEGTAASHLFKSQLICCRY